MIPELCDPYVSMSQSEKDSLAFTYALVSQTGESSVFTLQMVISMMVVFFSLIMITMLQRTQKLGELIMMVNQMISELQKFIFTFGLLLVGFMVVAS
mmetsp:Transcript_8089/g.13587  ORF Transcript_8089/g.13587 Transcript_8089/m.13587 type:complete len:97 (+) Transcript_8089:334-624(+)